MKSGSSSKHVDGPGTHLVIGATPHGVTLAGRLSFLGERTLLVGRRLKPAISKLRFEGWGSLVSLDIKMLTGTDVSQVKIVFFGVRAYDLEGCFKRYLPYLPRGVPVVVVCRGAIEDILARARKKYPDFLWRVGCCRFHTRHLGLGVHLLQSTENRLIWGPLEARPSWRTEVEHTLGDKDHNEFFHTQDNILPLVRKTWLFDGVINSLCAYRNYPKIAQLFNETRELHEVFLETFRLGKELWGRWDQTHEQLFTELISTISSNGELEAPMVVDLRKGHRNLNGYFAALAQDRRGFDQLNLIAQEIKNRTKFYQRNKGDSG